MLNLCTITIAVLVPQIDGSISLEWHQSGDPCRVQIMRSRPHEHGEYLVDAKIYDSGMHAVRLPDFQQHDTYYLDTYANWPEHHYQRYGPYRWYKVLLPNIVREVGR